MDTVSDKIFSQYGDTANEKGISQIPEPERTLIAVYTAQGIIGNGGFAYFLNTDFNDAKAYETIIISYRNIGLEEHAKSIENVLNLFPNNMLQSNSKELDRFIYKYISGDDTDNYSNIVEDAEAVFFNNVDSVYELADKHVLKNV